VCGDIWRTDDEDGAFLIDSVGKNAQGLTRLFVQVSSFGSLPRAVSTAALADGDAEAVMRPEAMSKVESIASTAVRAAVKMNVSL
jgi:hypothetical protein